MTEELHCGVCKSYDAAECIAIRYNVKLDARELCECDCHDDEDGWGDDYEDYPALDVSDIYRI